MLPVRSFLWPFFVSPFLKLLPFGPRFRHEAVRLLIEYRIHRLCVVQLALGNTVLCVLSQHHIMRYICQQLEKVPCLSLGDTSIGQFDNVPTIGKSTPLADVLELMMTHHLSGIAVVDDSGVVIDHYTRADTRVCLHFRSFAHKYS